MWGVKPSEAASRTKNPIRSIVDRLKPVPNHPKKLVSLSIGDPTVYGNFAVDDSISDAVVAAVKGQRANGYPHSCGYAHAREAVARKFSLPEAPLTADDVILTSGCSHAIFMVMDVLANPGDNILLPRPGFPLYQVVADYRGIECRYYNLLPERGWQADLEHMDSLVNERTRAILVNNPSNPCGSVYPREHLEAILALAERHRLPIIADEIYANMVFGGNTFHHMAALTKEVPVLSVGGLAKQYIVPGWRIGWILIQDKHNRLAEIRQPLVSLTQIILGCNSVIQDALPRILHETPAEFYTGWNAKLEEHARVIVESFSKSPVLSVVVPQGAMYVMVRVDIDCLRGAGIADDVDFGARLLQEENVAVLPGSSFGAPSFFRVVITPPIDMLREACERIMAFCERHAASHA